MEKRRHDKGSASSLILHYAAADPSSIFSAAVWRTTNRPADMSGGYYYGPKTIMFLVFFARGLSQQASGLIATVRCRYERTSSVAEAAFYLALLYGCLTFFSMISMRLISCTPEKYFFRLPTYIMIICGDCSYILSLSACGWRTF